MVEIDNLESLVKNALEQFFVTVVREGWRGREREAISLFAFEFLVPGVGTPGLTSTAQIGIECAVPQVTRNGKAQVCKDLVIWPRPRMTVWDRQGNPTRAPSLILEWKVAGYPSTSNRTIEDLIRPDVAWLQSFTARYRATRAAAVGITWTEKPQMRAMRVLEGHAEQDWWIAVG